ncbi:hypothetical protein KP509_38G050000 [Ceratopteris richardii]|uniref:Uncharacterized protein n=1 Tax=Ceratopteris richardii TaxID=49495 RepID=A0A8T2Q4R7_CERRI|nr:hypothetical protein KP509_38G050000 [Ceratopteris richardii]
MMMEDDQVKKGWKQNRLFLLDCMVGYQPTSDSFESCRAWVKKQEDPQSKVHASEHYWEPYLERHIRRVREQGININDDVEKLKLRTENKFELILDLAETANEFLVNHPEESIRKKPGLKVISDAINQTGTVEVEDAYPDATFEFLEELGMF